MADLANNPTAIAIATSAALGAFAGASYAMLTGKDDEIERYAGRAGPSTAACSGSCSGRAATSHGCWEPRR